MNSEIRINCIKVAVLIIGFLAAVSFVQLASASYRYYLEINMYSWPPIPTLISVLVFGICVAIFFLSIWKSPKKTELHIIRKIDWSVLGILIFFFVYLCNSFIRDGRLFFMTFQLIFLSAVVYLAVMLFLGEIIARARDGQLINTLYWVKFFRKYSVTSPPGFFMFIILIWDFFIILYICLLHFIDLWYALAPLSLAVFTLIVLSWFCSFLLNLSAEYDRANIEKVKSERFKAELITNVSHDIRTPLTAVISYVDLMKGLRIENEDFTEYLEVLDRKTGRLKTLIDDLLEASKAGTGNLSIDLNELDLCEIIGQVAGEFDEQFTARDLRLVLRSPDQPVSILADRRHLWRALENLFGNAAKYALPGTRVFADIGLEDSAEVGAIGGAAVFSLKNVSLNPIDLPAGALTEQFIRGERARQTEGNGLGLYIAKSLVELMGGSFTIRASGDLFEVEIRI